MLHIYTRVNDIRRLEFWKWVARRLIGKYSGPNAVEDSLLRGLKASGVPFKRHVRPRAGDSTIVLSGVEALREMIRLKQEGRLSHLIAGPNVVAHPLEADGIILNGSIDTILVPSKWVADLWTQEAPVLTDKVRVWPAGVAISQPSSRSGLPIVYDKLGDQPLLKQIQKTIGDHVLLTYGKFQRAEYLKALRTAPYLIYLSRSESQGLALQEAWAHDVPTLVHKSTRWQSGDLAWEDPQINCPYLTPELGAIFADATELPIMVEQAGSLHPKPYSDTHLSDRASAEKILNLL